MAVTEYIVVANMTERTNGPITSARNVKKEKGEKAKAEVELGLTQDAVFYRVMAESNKEAVQAVAQSVPGMFNDKAFVVKQSSGEELGPAGA
jgi:hypothetical protein